MRKAVRAIVIRGDQMLLMHRNKFGREYYTLLGGGIQPGEAPEQALTRELMEESGFRLVSARPVFIEEPGDPYGTQYIYLCEVEGDKPSLHAQSDEAKLIEMGNIHTPMWVPIKEFASAKFRTDLLQQAILFGLKHGFPAQPVQLDQQFLDTVQANIIAKKG
jgi:8-oxo-dGTP diphosphatase